LLLINSGDGIAHFTHLGGALAGLLFLWLRHVQLQGSFPGSRWLWNLRKKGFQQKFSSNSHTLEGEVGYLDEQKQLDAILFKISKSGIQSLSPTEQDFLQKASERNRTRRGV